MQSEGRRGEDWMIRMQRRKRRQRVWLTVGVTGALALLLGYLMWLSFVEQHAHRVIETREFELSREEAVH